jgi:hypothetical protein
MASADLRREFDWYLQNRFTLSAAVHKRRADPDAVVAGLSATQRQRYDALAATYAVDSWPQGCSPREYLLNLCFLDILDRYAMRPAAITRALDIGAGGWSYLPALVSWSGTPWNGIELDAHRRDWTLVTRRGYARYMMRAYPGCCYIAGSLTELGGAYDVVTWFLPFVRHGALDTAHLPRRFFAPETLLRHAWSLLAPGATMFVVNQSEEESAEQQRLFERTGIDAKATGLLESGFSPFHLPRFGWRTRKPL